MSTCPHPRSSLLMISLAAACTAPAFRGAGSSAAPPTEEALPVMSTEELRTLEDELVAAHGEASRPRIARGLAQVAALWRAGDGDLAVFAREHFITDAKLLEATRDRFEAQLEQLDGRVTEMRRELHFATDVATGVLIPADGLLAGMDPGAHLTEDLFASKAAFVVLLNFPLVPLAEQVEQGAELGRDAWAAVRLADRFARRVPGGVLQEMARVGAAADLYIAEYNIWMHHLVDDSGRRPFPSGMRLISHWNLRDELKACYADPHGAARQSMIAKVMECIVTQSIPAVVIDNPRIDWNPFSNQVSTAPADSVEADAPDRPTTVAASPEPNTRYAHWLAQFAAARRADPFSPAAPTALARSFEIDRKLPEQRVRAILEQVLTSPLVARVAALIREDLRVKQGRGLEPFDIWYSGFRPRTEYSEAELDAVTRERYPDARAFAADIPRILQQLGFPAERARFLAEHIVVDPARGAGHAMEARRRGDFPRLRTRIGKQGMDYKGYNIAVHELGHNVEQVISLYDVDHTLLAGVPNNAFTEAVAFVFQARDLELLGLSGRSAESRRRQVLDTFWATYEIAGVGLVDMEVWHWLYAHPQATAAELRDAVTRIAQQVWDRYYAPVLGGSGSVLLAIYSHLVAYPLYVTDYSLGHLIAVQIEEHLEGAPAPGPEIEGMVKVGSITPDQWMLEATGAPVSAEPLLEATAKAL